MHYCNLTPSEGSCKQEKHTLGGMGSEIGLPGLHSHPFCELEAFLVFARRRFPMFKKVSSNFGVLSIGQTYRARLRIRFRYCIDFVSIR